MDLRIAILLHKDFVYGLKFANISSPIFQLSQQINQWEQYDYG